MWGYALAKRGQGPKAQAVFWSVVETFLLDPAQAAKLGPKGRWWISKSLLELAQILDEMRASDAQLPLAERLRSRADEWAHTSGVALGFDLADVPPLGEALEESLLRIVDEALSNVLRHSGATRVDLALRREAERVRLTIADNGRGAPDEPAPGMGLRNMRERAQALPGGRFEFNALPGRGTRVAVSFLVAEISSR